MTDIIQVKRKNNPEVQKRSDEKRKNDPTRIAYMKQLKQQPHIIKSQMIAVWKRRGVISDDYDSLYYHYQNSTNCDLCHISYIPNSKFKKCLDHDHDTGLFRHFLCNNCNWTTMRRDRIIHLVPTLITDKHFECECGSVVLKTGKNRHMTANIHKNYFL